MDLQTLWFLILGALLMGYAILDGFDLGVGVMHLFVRDDTERRLVLNSIGPLWDGNEVWLVTFGGALFAAFPAAYAAVLSGFYLPVMLVLLSLVGRAISIEFRSKASAPGWRRYWDVSFFLSSITATFVFGLMLGNVVMGVPTTPAGDMTLGLFGALRPYPILVGVFAISVVAMHGAIYLYLKTEGELQAKMRPLMWRTFFAFAALYVVTTVVTLLHVPRATENFAHAPLAWVIVVLNVLAVANIPRAIHRGREAYAFVSSACTIAALTFLVGMALFPALLPSEGHGLDIYNAASSVGTLRRMAIIAAIGMPLVFTYTGIVYWVFRGKVKLDKFSY